MEIMKFPNNHHVKAIICLLSLVAMVIGGGAVVVAMVMCKLTVMERGDEEVRQVECRGGLYDAETGEVSFNTVMKLAATVFIVVLVSCVMVIVVWYRLYVHREEGKDGAKEEEEEEGMKREKSLYPHPEFSTSKQKLLNV